MKTLPVAVQVYSVREDAEKDFAGTMKKIKEIGYDGVELAGLMVWSPPPSRPPLRTPAWWPFPPTCLSRSWWRTWRAPSRSMWRLA